MNDIDVLIVTDALAAVASGDLGANVYLIDTNKNFGSGSEGQEELVTRCYDGQIITWRVEAVSPSSDVAIAGFTGQIITDNIVNPSKQGIEGDIYWEGRVESQGNSATYQYSVTLSIDGKSMSFDPFLDVVASP